MNPAPAHHARYVPRTLGPPSPLAGGERQLLTSCLDWHRTTFALKCAGVPAERLSERGPPPSTLSPHGLVWHLAGAERW